LIGSLPKFTAFNLARLSPYKADFLVLDKNTSSTKKSPDMGIGLWH